MAREVKTRSRREPKGGVVLACVVACCSLAACRLLRSEHPLEARARRVVVACPKELIPSSQLQDFPSSVCQAHCPAAKRRERLTGCFDVRTSGEVRQILAPGAQALMACKYVEAQ